MSELCSKPRRPAGSPWIGAVLWLAASIAQADPIEPRATNVRAAGPDRPARAEADGRHPRDASDTPDARNARAERLDALAEQLRQTPERRGRPFAIVDKPTATLIVYRGDGRLAGSAPVLLGRTLGDNTRPGTGQRSAAGTLQDADLTTPAGRFVSEPGRNLSGEAVVWLDYGNALAIHRLRPGTARAAREQRLGSARTAERRVSAGCVVVAVDFYESVVEPVLGRGRALIVITREDGGSRADEGAVQAGGPVDAAPGRAL